MDQAAAIEQAHINYIAASQLLLLVQDNQQLCPQGEMVQCEIRWCFLIAA